MTKDADRPQRFIEQDTRFATDVSQITENILHEVWGEPFDSDTMRARFIDPINEALERIFSASFATGLRLRKLIPALSGKPPDIRFQKGSSEVHYDLLSSGEKEVFNIILNLFTRREHFPNAIYFIDELDVHLHTSLQYALAKEIVERWIPEHSQLWTASHSLGFIDYANGSDDAAILDFDDLDFDQPQTLQPAPEVGAHLRHRGPPKFGAQGVSEQASHRLRKQGCAAIQRYRSSRAVVHRGPGQEFSGHSDPQCR